MTPRAIEGSGHIVTEQRPLADFQRVDLEGEGRLIMGPDEPASLEVRPRFHACFGPAGHFDGVRVWDSVEELETFGAAVLPLLAGNTS
jgi:hypothetical protein